MPRQYLFLGRYTAQGLAGAMQDGFATREQAIYKIADSVSAKIMSAGFGVGEYNLIVVVEADEAHAAAVALKVNPSGWVPLSVIPIMSAADMDGYGSGRCDGR